MRIIRPTAAPEMPSDPGYWRPQSYGRGFHGVRDAIVEPGWSGVRALARVEAGGAQLVDEDGVDCTAEFAEVAAAIADAAQASDMVLDGFLTVAATQVVAGKPLVEIAATTSRQVMTQLVLGGLARPSAKPRRLDSDRPVAFVAIDLLRIDGTPLLDVPLLERKRLLEGALAPAELIRITPFVRAPIRTFLETWRGMGFVELAYKDPNSRYLPGRRNNDWSIKPIPTK